MKISQIPQRALKHYHLNRSSDLDDRLSGDIRPWGGYLHIAKQPHYDEKIIWINPVSMIAEDLNALSLQFHGLGDSLGHFEHWQALSDIVMLRSMRPIIIDSMDEDKLLGLIDEHINNHLELIFVPEGESIEIDSRTLHALINPFDDLLGIVKERRESVDKSRSDINEDTREKDIYRILDNTQRDNAKAYDHPDYSWVKNEIFNFIKTIKPHTHEKKRTIKVKIKRD